MRTIDNFKGTIIKRSMCDVAQYIPIRCDLCTIGIGQSAYREMKNGKWGKWKVHEHVCSKPKVMRVTIHGEKKKLLLCDSCYETLKKVKDKASYIEKRGDEMLRIKTDGIRKSGSCTVGFGSQAVKGGGSKLEPTLQEIKHEI